MTPSMIKELEDRKVDNYYNSKITKILTINDVGAAIFIIVNFNLKVVL